MIDSITRQRVLQVTKAYWEERVQLEEFIKIASGKEIGHRIADYVDERTVGKLHADSEFDVKYEIDDKGKQLQRSMGDMWLRSNEIYNPVNIKAGVMGKSGQPNLVSLAKLLDRLLAQQIDSYDLLIIKMEIPNDPEGTSGITPHVFFVDMLDYLDYVTFDAGPGQAMLCEKQFYAAVTSGHPPANIPLNEKIVTCMERLEDGYVRLIQNRETKLQTIHNKYDRYKNRLGQVVNQGDLRFG